MAERSLLLQTIEIEDFEGMIQILNSFNINLQPCQHVF